MDNLNFDWDDSNIAHIAKHDVTPEEAEETILAEPVEYDFDPGEQGEPRWTYLGETATGRILFVVITIRDQKVRIVTALEPIKRVKVLYLKWKAEQQ